MTTRICTYNIEWFDNLFNSDNTLKTSAKAKKRLAAIANVWRHLKPDLVGIVEAPNSTATGSQSTMAKLENFALQENLQTNQALTGFISSGKQELAVMFNANLFTVAHAPGGSTRSKSNPRFDKQFYFDTDDDKVKEVYKHYRPPLETRVTHLQSGKKFIVMVVHTKSKGIFSNMDRLHWERASRRNRLKLYAECEWIRRHVDEFLDGGEEVIVMGDINDGPGMDYYEFKFGRSVVETIIGDIYHPDYILRSLAGKPAWTAYGWKPSSARFKDSFTEDYVNVLIDHILVSPGLPIAQSLPYKIWNPYEDPDAKLIKDDLLEASDHFPITLDLDL